MQELPRIQNKQRGAVKPKLVARPQTLLAAVLICILGMAGTSRAQTATAQITAIVKDNTGAVVPEVRSSSESRITVASYYFGNYHPNDPRNEKLKGKGWSEWELVKAAKPRFSGQHQPNVPLWGCTDESDPREMARKIDAAADHAIDAFIFDWYYYNDGPFLQDTVDEGFLGALNNRRMKFAFMWANHDWVDIHPYRRGAPPRLLYSGVTSPATFERICDLLIKNYFQHPSYWRIDGKPYFSFYDLTNLLENFGSVAAARAALDRFRAKAVAAGLPGLHLNAVVWQEPILPKEKRPANVSKLVHDLGFDSVTSYVWIHHVNLPKLQTDYNYVRDRYFDYWTKAEKLFDVPYFPNVTMGSARHAVQRLGLWSQALLRAVRMKTRNHTGLQQIRSRERPA